MLYLAFGAWCLWFLSRLAPGVPALMLYLYLSPPVLWLCPLLFAAVLSLWRSLRWPVWLGLIAGLLTTLIWCEFSFGVPEPADSAVRIVSVNAKSWSIDPTVVVDSIERLEPDVIFFQELWSPRHLKEVERALPHYNVRGDSTFFAGTAIATRWEIDNCELPPPDNSAAVIAQIGTKRVLLLSMQGRKSHYLTPDGLSETMSKQQAQMEGMRQFLDGVGLPVLIGVDLNAPGHAPLTGFLGGRLEDGFAVAGTGFGYTFPALGPVYRLDRIYYSLELGRGVDCRTFLFGSDHKGVCLDLSLEPDFQPSHNRSVSDELFGRSVERAVRGRERIRNDG